MNYYEHHIGDYDADTSHLSWVEDMAYTRLIRLYYRREKPIPADVAEACRLVRATAKDQKEAVAAILREFFTLTEDGWHQARCDGEIVAYQDRVDHNRRVGKKGGRPKQNRDTDKPDDNPPGFQTDSDRKPKSNPLQTPDSRLHLSVPDGTGAEAPTARDEVFAAGVPLLMAAAVTERNARSMLAMLSKKHGEEAVSAAIAETARNHPGEPVSWIQTILNRNGGRGKPNAQEALEAANREVGRRFLENNQ